MKKILLSLTLCFLFGAPLFSDTCSATASDCGLSCTATSPANGSVDCFEFSDRVECYAYQGQEQIQATVKECGNGGNPLIDCQIYWWLCSGMPFF